MCRPAPADYPHSALSPRQRMVVEASALGDLALRTWVASLLTTTVTPFVVAGALRQSDASTERSNLDFYAELGRREIPRGPFRRPPSCRG